jgi:hypothetical protein
MEEDFRSQGEIAINKLKSHLKKEKESGKQYKEALIIL